MAYMIHKYPTRELVSSGQTRPQIISALAHFGLMREDEKCPTMPRFGSETLVVRPAYDPRGSFVITNV